MTPKMTHEADGKPAECSPDPISTIAATDRAHALRRSALIVDDEQGICEFISAAVAELNVMSESCYNADQAAAAVEHGQPDIIFLDIALKGSDAIDVIRNLAVRQYAGIVQLISGNQISLLEDVRRIGARHGLNMRHPLQKPIRLETIRRVISRELFNGQPDAQRVLNPSPIVDIDQALASGWLEICYQPRFQLHTRTFASVEALVRCHHPVHGALLPQDFSPGATRRGLEQITEYAIASALRDWDDAAGVGTPRSITIDVSMASLIAPNLVAWFRERAERKKGPRLILELGKNEVLRDIPLVHEIATQLRIYGIALALHDFADDYSSFELLGELPFAELKLNRKFVEGCARDATQAGVCQMAVDLAHRFGATAVADGIEDARHLEVLRLMNCDIGQGSFLAPLMPKSALAALVHGGTAPFTIPSDRPAAHNST
jgi:EAL domain-containing protein (putative c-di-GMP-specific phosphodiesterase class I)/ActR/RegA family two-component response regulator